MFKIVIQFVQVNFNYYVFYGMFFSSKFFSSKIMTGLKIRGSTKMMKMTKMKKKMMMKMMSQILQILMKMFSKKHFRSFFFFNLSRFQNFFVSKFLNQKKHLHHLHHFFFRFSKGFFICGVSKGRMMPLLLFLRILNLNNSSIHSRMSLSLKRRGRYFFGDHTFHKYNKKSRSMQTTLGLHVIGLKSRPGGPEKQSKKMNGNERFGKTLKDFGILVQRLLLHQFDNEKKNLTIDLLYEYNRVKNDNVLFFNDFFAVIAAFMIKKMTTTTTKLKKKVEIRAVYQNKIIEQIIHLQSLHQCENKQCLNFKLYCGKNFDNDQYYKMNVHQFVVGNKTLKHDQLRIDSKNPFSTIRYNLVFQLKKSKNKKSDALSEDNSFDKPQQQQGPQSGSQ